MKLKPVDPGEILRDEFMAPLGLGMNKMATDLRIPVTRIADIVNDKHGITAETALRFARYFKNSPAFSVPCVKFFPSSGASYWRSFPASAIIKNDPRAK